jgi:hypothetical protein
MILDFDTRTVRPEPVEGLSLPLQRRKERKGFDRLSPNGLVEL